MGPQKNSNNPTNPIAPPQHHNTSPAMSTSMRTSHFMNSQQFTPHERSTANHVSATAGSGVDAANGVRYPHVRTATEASESTRGTGDWDSTTASQSPSNIHTASASSHYKQYTHAEKISRKILAVKAFEMNNIFCWYNDPVIEQQFLIAQFLQYRVRQLMFFFFAFLGLLLTVSLGPKDSVTLIFAIPPAAVSIGLGGLDLCVVVLSRKYATASLPRKGFAHGESVDFSKLLLLARVHEVLTGLTTLFLCVYYPVYLRWKSADCKFSTHHDRNILDNEDTGCAKMHLWWFLFIMIPVIVGQPRFVLVTPCYVLTACFTIVYVRFHGPSALGTVVLLAIYVAHVVFLGVLKYILEQQDRRRFEADALLRFKTEEVEARYNDLRDFVLGITPPYLQRRLHSSNLVADVSQEALSLVIQVHNVGAYVKNLLPADAATSIAAYCFQCETEAKDLGFHHIRTVGDANYLVANLFRQDAVSTFIAAVNGIRFATQTVFVDGISTCAGLSIGFMTGLPIGTTCIRYDIFGSCIAAAQSMSLSCPPNCINITKGLYEDIGGSVLVTQANMSGSLANDSVVSVTSSGGGGGGGESSTDTRGSINNAANVGIVAIGGVREVSEWDEDSQIRLEDNGSTTNASTGSTTNNNTTSRMTLGDDGLPVEVGGNTSGSTNISLDFFNGLDNTKISVVNLRANSSSKKKKEGSPLEPGNNPSSTATNLETSSDCYLLRRFNDEETQQLALKQQRRYYRWSFIASVVLFFVQVTLAIISAAEERHDKLDANLYMFFALHGIAAVGFVVTFMAALNSFTVLGRHTTWQLWLMFASCTVSLFGNSFGRPSSVGDNSGFLYWAFLFGVIFTGAPVKQILTMQFVWTLLFYILAFSIRPIIDPATIIIAVGALIPANVAILHSKLQIELLSNLVRSKEALTRVEQLEGVRQAVFNSQIPPAVQHKITPESLAQESVDCWSTDQCVVMTIKVTQDEEKLASLVGHPEELKEYAEGPTHLIEDLLAQTPHETLSIIKVFGGVVMLAGPLASSLTSASTGRYLLAVEDAFHLLDHLRRRVGPSGMSRFTITIVNEQVINVLRFSEYPSFELMGPVVSFSRAMMMACPADGMVVTTEKLAELYQREMPTAAVSCGHHFSDSESWRFRHVGILRISRVTEAAEPTNGELSDVTHQ